MGTSMSNPAYIHVSPPVLMIQKGPNHSNDPSDYAMVWAQIFVIAEERIEKTGDPEYAPDTPGE